MADEEKEHEHSEPKNQIVRPAPVQIQWSVPPPIVKMRVYYSMYHQWSARHFAAQAGRIEADAGGATSFNIQHRSFVTASIFASVAFLEAAINELFKDSWDNVEGGVQHSAYVSALGPTIVRQLADVWASTEAMNKHRSSLEKYDIVLAIANQPRFDKSRQPYQDAKLLIQLRNELVHFKPETLGGDDSHRLDNRLRGKFPWNKLMSGSGNPSFPDHWLGHGCCEWAASSSEAFADEFFSRVGLAPRYRAVEWPDPTLASVEPVRSVHGADEGGDGGN